MQATYTHDSLGRLTQVVFDTGESVVYNYDSVGNRTSVVRVGSLAATDGDPSISQVRVCLTQGDPWGLTQVTNGGTIFVEPIYDGRIGIWSGSASYSFKTSAFGVSLSGLAAGCYRLYVYDSDDDAIVDAGVLVPWIDDTTPPADTLVSDGYLVRTGGTNRRAIADIMLHASGQCDWREARRGICHIDERIRRPAVLTAFPSEDTWSVPRNTSAWRRITGGTGVLGEHFVEFILSNSTLVNAKSAVIVDRDGGSGTYRYEFGFGLDSTTTNVATQQLGHDQGVGNVLTQIAMSKFVADTTAGKRTLTVIERNNTSRDVTAFGDNGLSPAVFKSGMLVEIKL